MPFMGGIAGRLAVFSSLVALVATVTVGYMVFRGARDSLIGSASDRVAHTAETVTIRTWTTLDAIGDDVLFLAATPPVQGIVRARARRSGLDPEWSMFDEEWGQQLAETFRAFLVSRSSYLQVRFIGLENDGRELVRVERRGGKAAFANPEDLRARGDAPYVRSAVALPPGGMHFSDVRWSDPGEGIPPNVPILYITTPVYSEEGQVFGVVVVTVDVRDILGQLKSLIDPNQTLYVANSNGEILHTSGRAVDGDGKAAAETGGDDAPGRRVRPGRVDAGDPAPADSEAAEGPLATVVPPEADTTAHPAGGGTAARPRLQTLFPRAHELISGLPREVRMLDANLGREMQGIAYFEEITLEPYRDSPSLIVGVTEPHATILADVRKIRNQSALITLLLCLAAIGVALSASRYLTQPLRQITKAVATFGKKGDQVALPADRNDEIGVLARSFDAMQRQIHDQIGQIDAERMRLAELSATLEQRVHERTAELERLNRELESSNRELREIANVASHDLQEPLRKLRSFADLLESEYGDALGEEGRFYAQRIYELAERMSVLMRDVLAFSRVTSKTRPFERVDLCGILRGVVSDRNEAIHEAGGAVHVEPLPAVTGDPTQLRELFEHLIDNALRFRRPDTAPDIRVRGEKTDGICRIDVEDNGTGFDEKYLDRIFAPFERLHGRRAPEGTGMGLTICRRIVENHRGTIAVRSTPGKGSTFTVKLPAASD